MGLNIVKRFWTFINIIRLIFQNWKFRFTYLSVSIKLWHWNQFETSTSSHLDFPLSCVLVFCKKWKLAWWLTDVTFRHRIDVCGSLQVSECGWAQKKAPTLANLFAICKNMHLWLRQNPKNICVVHCLDGKAQSATVIGALLVFCRLFDSAETALHMFTARRLAPGVSPSQKRLGNGNLASSVQDIREEK